MSNSHWLRASGTSEYVDALTSQDNRKQMIAKMNKTIKECLSDHFSTGKSITESSVFVKSLCDQIELFLTHKLKTKYSYGIWNILQLLNGVRVDSLTTTTNGAPLVWKDQFEYIDSLSEVTTENGKAKAFIRRCLNESILNSAVESLTTNHDILRTYYEEDSIIRNKEDSDVFRSILVPLETIPFHIDYNDSSFDQESVNNSTIAENTMVNGYVLNSNSPTLGNNNSSNNINSLNSSNNSLIVGDSNSSDGSYSNSPITTPIPLKKKKVVTKSLNRVININGEGESEVVESKLLKDTVDDKGVTTTTTKIFDEKTGKTKIIKKIKVTKKVLKVNNSLNTSSNNLNSLTSSSNSITSNNSSYDNLSSLTSSNSNISLSNSNNNNNNSNISNDENDNSGSNGNSSNENSGFKSSNEKTPEIVQMIKDISLSDIKSRFSSFFTTISPKSTLTSDPTTSNNNNDDKSNNTPIATTTDTETKEPSDTNNTTDSSEAIETVLTTAETHTVNNTISDQSDRFEPKEQQEQQENEQQQDSINIEPTLQEHNAASVEVGVVVEHQSIQPQDSINEVLQSNTIVSLEESSLPTISENVQVDENKVQMNSTIDELEKDGASILVVEEKVSDDNSKILMNSIDSFSSLTDVMAKLDVVTPVLTSEGDADEEQFRSESSEEHIDNSNSSNNRSRSNSGSSSSLGEAISERYFEDEESTTTIVNRLEHQDDEEKKDNGDAESGEISECTFEEEVQDLDEESVVEKEEEVEDEQQTINNEIDEALKLEIAKLESIVESRTELDSPKQSDDETVVESISLESTQPTVVAEAADIKIMTLEEEVAAYERHRAMLEQQSTVTTSPSSTTPPPTTTPTTTTSPALNSSTNSTTPIKLHNSNDMSVVEAKLLEQIDKMEDLIVKRDELIENNNILKENSSFSVMVSVNNPYLISLTPPQTPEKHNTFSPYFVPANTATNVQTNRSNSTYSDVDDLTDNDELLDFEHLDIENNTNNNNSNNNNNDKLEYLNNLSTGSSSSSPISSRSNSVSSLTLSLREDYIPATTTTSTSSLSDSDGIKNPYLSNDEIVNSNLSSSNSNLTKPRTSSASVNNPFISHDAGQEEKAAPDPKDYKWTPLRRRLYFDIQTQYTIREQNNQCAGCSRNISGLFTSSRYCEYSGKYFCSGCHSKQIWYIPGRILVNWDFKQYQVSNFHHAFLADISREPLFDLATINPKLYKNNTMLKMRNLRRQMFFLKDFLKSCTATGPQVYKIIGSKNDYLANEIDFYSLGDLVHHKKLYESLRIIVAQWLNHVEDCVLCKAKGSYCPLCDAKEPIYPYNISKVVQCGSCQSVHHKACYVQHKCPKCLRIAKRKILQNFEKAKKMELEHRENNENNNN